MLNKIMVAIDGSPLSFQALDFAMGLGKACGSRLLSCMFRCPLMRRSFPSTKWKSWKTTSMKEY